MQESTLEWAVDALFILDLLITFRTAYYNENDVLVTNMAMICQRYFPFWFIIDLVSCFPWFLIDNIDGGDSASITKSLRLFRLVRLMRFSNVLMIFNKVKDKVLIHPGFFNIPKGLFTIILTAHLISCLWWCLGTVISDQPWYSVFDMKHKSLAERYTISLYWTFTTISGVGYGDVVPVNSSERIFVIGVMFLGPVITAILVGQISCYLQELNFSKSRINSKIDKVCYFIITVSFDCYHSLPRRIR